MFFVKKVLISFTEIKCLLLPRKLYGQCNESNVLENLLPAPIVEGMLSNLFLDDIAKSICNWYLSLA